MTLGRFSGGGEVKSTTSLCPLPGVVPLDLGLTGELGGVFRLKNDDMDGLPQPRFISSTLTEPATTPWASWWDRRCSRCSKVGLDQPEDLKWRFAPSRVNRSTATATSAAIASVVFRGIVLHSLSVANRRAKRASPERSPPATSAPSRASFETGTGKAAQ